MQLVATTYGGHTRIFARSGVVKNVERGIGRMDARFVLIMYIIVKTHEISDRIVVGLHQHKVDFSHLI